MSTSTATKTTAEILADTPFVVGLLLMRFERDAIALSDYLTREEQDKWLGHIEYTIRNKLLIERCWSHEAANLLAKEYRQKLNMRLTKAEFFKMKSFNAHK